MEWTPLHGRARLLFYMQAGARLLLFWLPVSTALTVGLTFLTTWINAVGAGLGLLFLNFLLAVWMPALAWSRWGYAVREEDLLISRGVIFRSITAIPTSRIQHVDTRQGPIEQSLGLARVQIHTASGVGGDGVIPGLAVSDAEALRDQLVRVSGDGGV